MGDVGGGHVIGPYVSHPVTEETVAQRWEHGIALMPRCSFLPQKKKKVNFVVFELRKGEVTHQISATLVPEPF